MPDDADRPDAARGCRGIEHLIASFAVDAERRSDRSRALK
jgi:hypothetical protein